MINKLYYAPKVMCFNNRPVQKVEVIKEDDKTITFETDYPVEQITILREEFFLYFREW